jgi:hypothetical protein
MRLEDELWKGNHLSVYGSAIHGLLTIKKPMITICEFILQMDADDHKEMIFAIGQETLDRVKKYYYQQ